MIQEKISEMMTLTNAMRLLGRQASTLLDQGKDAKVECSIGKVFATGLCVKRGGRGFADPWGATATRWRFLLNGIIAISDILPLQKELMRCKN